MSNEAVSDLMMEHIPNTYVYEIIETTDTLATAIEQITTADVEQVALVTITVYFEAEGKPGSSRLVSTDPNTCAIYLMNSLRPFVRRTDAVFLLGHSLHFLLRGANLQGGEIVQTRLWDALLWRIHNTTEGEIPRPDSITIGHSAYPIPDSNIDEFIEAAGVVSLRRNFASEKPVHKTLARQARTAQLDAEDEEWPTLARKLGIPYLSLLPRKPPERVQQLVNKMVTELCKGSCSTAHCNVPLSNYPCIIRCNEEMRSKVMNPCINDRGLCLRSTSQFRKETFPLWFHHATHPSLSTLGCMTSNPSLSRTCRIKSVLCYALFYLTWQCQNLIKLRRACANCLSCTPSVQVP